MMKNTLLSIVAVIWLVAFWTILLLLGVGP